MRRQILKSILARALSQNVWNNYLKEIFSYSWDSGKQSSLLNKKIHFKGLQYNLVDSLKYLAAASFSTEHFSTHFKEHNAVSTVETLLPTFTITHLMIQAKCFMNILACSFFRPSHYTLNQLVSLTISLELITFDLSPTFCVLLSFYLLLAKGNFYFVP